MNTLIFHNPGEIDIRGACIAGLSAKESNSPIGYFGTGLKYSIACILRWGGEITIYSGVRKHVFEAGSIDYRGIEFKQIYMDGNPLGFTTEYGKNWEPWQVFRELYANARDEGGDVIHAEQPLMPPTTDQTLVVVNCTDLTEAFYDRHEIIIPLDRHWEQQSEGIQFNSTPSGGLYYRGVRVHEQAALYTWNFLKKVQLTEDRTLKSVIELSCRFDDFLTNHLHDIDIAMRLLELKYSGTEPEITRTIKVEGKPTTLKQRPVECLLMDWFTTPSVPQSWHSDSFKEATKRLYQRDPTTYSRLRPYVKNLDRSLVESKLYVMNFREQLMFDKSKELVSLFGFKEEIETLPIMVQELGGSTLGMYEHGSIYLSPKLFDQGTKQLVATLYEECYHHRTQNQDCTYNMQTDLFNIIISLNEEVHKVIC